MVLGLRSKNKQSTSCRVDYFVELQEIRPWPPSKSMKSIHSLVLQWENGDQNLGMTSPFSPSIEQGKIELKKSFMLQVTLKGNSSGHFQKNILQLHLYELKKDGTVKGQQLGTTMLDLAQHGIVKDSLRIGLPLNFKRSIKSLAQPILYVRIKSIERSSPGSSSRELLSKEVSLGKDVRESVSALMSEEYAEEDEIASFTDDDVSSYSSVTNSSSIVENNIDLVLQTSSKEDVHPENVAETTLKKEGKEGQLESSLPTEFVTEEPELGTKGEQVHVDALVSENHILAQPSQENLSFNHVSLVTDDACSSITPRGTFKTTAGISDTKLPTSLSSHEEEPNPDYNYAITTSATCIGDLHQEVQTDVDSLLTKEIALGQLLNEDIGFNAHIEESNTSISNVLSVELSNERDAYDENMNDKSQESRSSLDEVLGSPIKSNEHNKEGNVMVNGTTKAGIQSLHCVLLPDSLSKAQISSGEHARAIQHHEHPISSIGVSRSEVLRERNNGFFSHDKSKNISFSVRSSLHSLGTNGHAIAIQHLEDVKEIAVLEDVSVGGAKSSSNFAGRFNRKNVSEFRRNVNFDNKVHELESRIEKLEGELREAAAIECAVYTIVAEHGCSLQKMHSPARRLSRLYIHASAERMGNTAKSAVSGLTLIARACGNDVSRLTFWLTNTIVLRTFLSHTIGHSDKPNSSKHLPVGRNSLTRTGKKSPLKWGSHPCLEEQFALTEELDNWEDPQTFVNALEKLESWIFCRIVESVWWQTFTPYMQTSKEFGQSLSFTHQKKRFEKERSFNDRRKESYCLEIWKKAFQDASEKLCPVRADGRECGCLPIIVKLVMEQCVARLDVAMLNALLRESDDELPTDPVADPISNHKVLPISPGKPSFGAGARLKNAIGNWSRFLTDLFGMDVDDSAQDKNDEYDERVDIAASLKSFPLLNALSDLFMLPKDMLVEEKVRKEACPKFNASMIKRILSSFLPDEFCPDEVPASVFEALDCEVMSSNEDGEDGILPFSASPINYSPPSASSIQNAIGFIAHSPSQLKRSSSSPIVLKSYASDDELEELNSPLFSIVFNKSSSPEAKTNQNIRPQPCRYQLLREEWSFDE